MSIDLYDVPFMILALPWVNTCLVCSSKNVTVGTFDKKLKWLWNLHEFLFAAKVQMRFYLIQHLKSPPSFLHCCAKPLFSLCLQSWWQGLTSYPWVLWQVSCPSSTQLSRNCSVLVRNIRDLLAICTHKVTVHILIFENINMNLIINFNPILLTLFILKTTLSSPSFFTIVHVASLDMIQVYKNHENCHL